MNARYYEVSRDGAEPRIVEAASASAAIRHAAHGVYRARVLNARDLAQLVKGGVAIEVAAKAETAGDAP
jgi:hypothetical protein